MPPLILLAASYLLGAIPFGLLVSKLKGAPDPRAVGSGNIGATNVVRAAGWAAGLVTLTLDITKGYVAVWSTALRIAAARTGAGGWAYHHKNSGKPEAARMDPSEI